MGVAVTNPSIAHLGSHMFPHWPIMEVHVCTRKKYFLLVPSAAAVWSYCGCLAREIPCSVVPNQSKRKKGAYTHREEIGIRFEGKTWKKGGEMLEMLESSRFSF